MPVGTTGDRARRGVVFAALFVLCGGYGARLAHATTAEHVRCPEHGELLHGAAGTPRSDAPTIAPTPGNLDHDHCEVEWLSRFEAESSASPAAFSPSKTASCAPPVAADPSPAIPLSFAPKTSPPPS